MNDKKDNAANEGEVSRFLNFSLGGEQYAIPLLTVREVIAVPTVTPLPFAPPYFLGIMNLRGQVISVLDLRAKLNIKSQSTSETSVIICDLAPYSFGLVVDSISRVLTLNDEEVSERPEMTGVKSADWITGVYQIDNQIVLLLDVAKVLNVEDRNTLQKSAVGKAG